VIPELKPSTVLLRIGPTTVAALAQSVAEAMGTAKGLESSRVELAFLEAMRGEGFSVGGGVAIPHAEMQELTETVVGLVTLSSPLPLRTIDGVAPDVFWFILSKPDPHGHLLLLAHLARLTQSRTFLDGVRRAQTPEEAVELVRAAEMRHSVLRPVTAPSTPHALFVVSIGGEKVVDALLINLVDQGFGDACVLEAQSLREAAAREVPLFAGFRDLFGDPGGRRILILEASADRADDVIEAVRTISQKHRAKDARVSVVPIQTRWIGYPFTDEEASRGH
jgi:mannitol/fructose-specific phosphotransferase system IIA component (Ntr-type)